MNYSDETLMAFADGEIDAELGAQIEKALQSDPDLARRVAMHRDLRQRLQSAYAPELDEPIPERLLASLLGEPAQASLPQGSKIISLDAARAARVGKPHRSWSAPQWGAVAASLFLGVGAGYLAWHASRSGSVGDRQGVLVAEAALSQALSQSPSGETVPGTTVKIALSYRSKTGELCRSFSDSAIAGIACRDGEQWRIRLLTQGVAVDENATGGYRPAASALPPSVVQMIDSDIAGEPLDAKAEIAARARGWQAQ